MRVEPINCFRPAPERAGHFASPPYDVFDDAQARAYVAEHPASFMEIDRPETAFPLGQDPHAPEVYAHAVKLLNDRVKDGTLLKEERPCLYAYRLEQDGHAQTGIVAAVAVDDYFDGTVRRHEQVREEKVIDRIDHITAVTAQTSPVLLAYLDNPVIDLLVGLACTGEPLYDFTDETDVRHTVWRLSREAAAEAICATFEHVPCAYIADGHHRAEAMARMCVEAREQGDAGPREYFLSLLFPAHKMCVHAYNRVVFDTNGLDEQELVDALASAGISVGERTENPVEPSERRVVGLYAFGAWRELRFIDDEEPAEDDPASALDVSMLQNRVLAPILGVEDPTTDKRIAFVGGETATEELERLAGETGVAFTLYPTSLEELMAVSDAGQLMPPKSTWFAPKPASGLFLRRI